MHNWKLIAGLSSVLLLLSACSERKGLETGKKLFAHYCVSCHQTSKTQPFLSDIKLGSLTRRSSLTVTRTILDDKAHGKKVLKKLNELSQKEAEKLVKYLYQLKISYETNGSISPIK